MIGRHIAGLVLAMGTLGAVFSAYEDVGIRASISGHVINRKLPDTIVYLNELLPANLRREIDAQTPPTVAAYLSFCKDAFKTHHNRAGRLRFMLAPTGPQRCTDRVACAAVVGEGDHRHATSLAVFQCAGQDVVLGCQLVIFLGVGDGCRAQLGGLVPQQVQLARPRLGIAAQGSQCGVDLGEPCPCRPQRRKVGAAVSIERISLLADRQQALV